MNKKIQSGGLRSSVGAENHFLSYIIITLAVAVLLVFALFMGMAIHNKIQTSEEIAKEDAPPAAAPPALANNPAPQPVFDQNNNSSTNAVIPSFPQATTITNSF